MAREQEVVRRAEAGDLDALIELRLENAHVHTKLDPTVYRVPNRHAVEEHFRRRIVEDPALWVAVAADGSVSGMVEVLASQPPPDHQILRPVPAAHVHIVVRRGARRRGVASALLARAEQWAVEQGIERLIAGIQADNSSGLAFYDRAGYLDNGRTKIKNVARRVP